MVSTGREMVGVKEKARERVSIQLTNGCEEDRGMGMDLGMVITMKMMMVSSIVSEAWPLPRLRPQLEAIG